MKPTQFWRWANMEAGAAGKPTLWIEGLIYPESPWYLEDGTLCAPDAFRRQLEALEGKDIDININSRGGDASAGAAIYTLLRQRRGSNTFKILALAASAATLPPMAPGKVLLSPVATMMIHNPSVYVEGSFEGMDLARVQNYLAQLKASVITAYMEGTGKSEQEISDLMDAETIYTAQGAIDAGFADEIMPAMATPAGAEMSFSRRSIMQACMDATRSVITARFAQDEQAERAAVMRYLETY